MSQEQYIKNLLKSNDSFILGIGQNVGLLTENLCLHSSKLNHCNWITKSAEFKNQLRLIHEQMTKVHFTHSFLSYAQKLFQFAVKT